MANEGRILKRNYPASLLGGAGNGSPVKNADGEIVRRRAPFALSLGQTGTVPASVSFSGFAAARAANSEAQFVFDPGRPVFADCQYGYDTISGGVLSGPAEAPYQLAGPVSQDMPSGSHQPYYETVIDDSREDGGRWIVDTSTVALLPSLGGFRWWAPGWAAGQGGAFAAFAGGAYAAIGAAAYAVGLWYIFAHGTASAVISRTDDANGVSWGLGQTFDFRAVWAAGPKHRTGGYIEFALAGFEAVNVGYSGEDATGAPASAANIDARDAMRGLLAATALYL